MNNNTKIRLHLSKNLFESIAKEVLAEAKRPNDGYSVAVKQPKQPKQSKDQATSPEVQKTDKEVHMKEVETNVAEGNESLAKVISDIKSLSKEQLAKLKQYWDNEISPKSVQPGGKYHGKAATLPSNIKEEEEIEEDIKDTVKKVGSAVKGAAEKAKSFYSKEISPKTVKPGGHHYEKGTVSKLKSNI